MKYWTVLWSLLNQEWIETDFLKNILIDIWDSWSWLPPRGVWTQIPRPFPGSDSGLWTRYSRWLTKLTEKTIGPCASSTSHRVSYNLWQTLTKYLTFTFTQQNTLSSFCWVRGYGAFLKRQSILQEMSRYNGWGRVLTNVLPDPSHVNPNDGADVTT